MRQPGLSDAHPENKNKRIEISKRKSCFILCTDGRWNMLNPQQVNKTRLE